MSTELEDMARWEQLAEAAYAAMYDSRAPAGCYSDLKYYFAMAITAANRAGRRDEVARIKQRLAHCIAVYRSQFSTF